MRLRVTVLLICGFALFGQAVAAQSEHPHSYYVHEEKVLKAEIAHIQFVLSQLAKGLMSIVNKERHEVWVTQDVLDTLVATSDPDYPGLDEQASFWKENKQKVIENKRQALKVDRAELARVQEQLRKDITAAPGDLTLKKVDVKDATEGDPKAWHYPKSAAFDVKASFDYPGLATPTFTITAPEKISGSGGSLHLSVDLNGSGRASGDAHLNLWVSGLSFEGPDVIEVKVNANETKTVSHDYTLRLKDPKAKEVSFTVGLTWGGPKYTFIYRR